MYDKRIAQFRI